MRSWGNLRKLQHSLSLLNIEELGEVYLKITLVLSRKVVAENRIVPLQSLMYAYNALQVPGNGSNTEQSSSRHTATSTTLTTTTELERNCFSSGFGSIRSIEGSIYELMSLSR